MVTCTFVSESVRDVLHAAHASLQRSVEGIDAYAQAARRTTAAGRSGPIALVVLDSPAFQVSELAALSAVASALIALPLGVRIEHQYKRPVMITADLARCVLLASIPVAMAFDRLTFTQLCAPT